MHRILPAMIFMLKIPSVLSDINHDLDIHDAYRGFRRGLVGINKGQFGISSPFIEITNTIAQQYITSRVQIKSYRDHARRTLKTCMIVGTSTRDSNALDLSLIQSRRYLLFLHPSIDEKLLEDFFFLDILDSRA